MSASDEAQLHVQDVVALESVVSEIAAERDIYRSLAFTAISMLHNAALRAIDQDAQIRQFFALR